MQTVITDSGFLEANANIENHDFSGRNSHVYRATVNATRKVTQGNRQKTNYWNRRRSK